MEISDLSIKSLVIGMLKELSEDLNGIKQIKSEMKDTLINKEQFTGNQQESG